MRIPYRPVCNFKELEEENVEMEGGVLITPNYLVTMVKWSGVL